MTDAGPRGVLALRTMAMPADTNPAGDVFGGWLMAQMDLAAGMIGVKRSGGRVATVAVDGMSFHRPVRVGDAVGCYGDVVRVGRTSLEILVETWVERDEATTAVKVTEARFTMVALSADGRPRRLPGPDLQPA
ncbi:MAG: acyl-CoA thioesterase [Pseudomonadota bacterium]